MNRVTALDTFQIRPDLPKVLDITCLHTEFGLGRFASSMTCQTMFAVLFVTWLCIWGCPGTTLTDRGSEVENDPFVNALTSMCVHWRPIPTEAPWGIDRDARHHGPIHQAYLRIAAETPTLAPDLILAMAYKARNDAPRARGSCPTTAVTGAPPSLLIGDNHLFNPAIAFRHRAMQAARASIEAYTAADCLRGALSHPGTNVPFVEVGQAVWFHRDKHGWLQGRVHSLDGKTVYVTRNNRIYSSHEAHTKPYVSCGPPPPPTTTTPPVSAAALPIRTHSAAPPPPTTLPTTTRALLTNPPDPDSPSHPRWDAAKRTELNSIDSIDCKTTLPASHVPAGKQIFHYLWRVTHKPNRGNSEPAERARFCVAGNRDWHKANTVATFPVTPQRSIRAIVAASVILHFSIHTEDFLRAYIQSDILPEPTYVWAPPEAGEPDGSVWAFHRAMYGKNDAGRHFHFNTQSRFLSIPHITLSSAFDTVYTAPLRGAVCSDVDDTLHAGTPAFLAAAASIVKEYNTHRPDHDNVTFAGISARTNASGIHCDAGAYAATISPLPLCSPLSTSLPNLKDLHSLAAKLLWVGCVARPDVLTDATQLANLLNPTGADARRANAALASLYTRPVSLHFTRLNADSLCLDVYADYSGSAVSPLHKRQLGFIIALTDNTRRFSLLHWASHRPHRVCRGSCAGELLALADAVAAALDIRLLLQELLSRRIPLAASTDSSAAYGLVTSFRDPTDMSSKSDLFKIRHVLLNGIMQSLHLITGDSNPADALSKPTFARPAPNHALTTTLSSGFVRATARAHTTSASYRNEPRRP